MTRLDLNRIHDHPDGRGVNRCVNASSSQIPHTVKGKQIGQMVTAESTDSSRLNVYEKQPVSWDGLIMYDRKLLNE